jgi:hypothetical protein
VVGGIKTRRIIADGATSPEAGNLETAMLGGSPLGFRDPGHLVLVCEIGEIDEVPEGAGESVQLRDHDRPEAPALLWHPGWPPAGFPIDSGLPVSVKFLMGVPILPGAAQGYPLTFHRIPRASFGLCFPNIAYGLPRDSPARSGGDGWVPKHYPRT